MVKFLSLIFLSTVIALKKTRAISFPLLLLLRERATTIAIVGRAITILEARQKRSHQSMYKPINKISSKEVKSDNFSNCKVWRAITKWRAIEKSPILVSPDWKRNKLTVHQNLFNFLVAPIIFLSPVGLNLVG